MLHNNSNASKKTKLVAEQAAAAASNAAGTAGQERQFTSGQRGASFEHNGGTGTAAPGMGRNKARIAGKLQGVDNEGDILNLNADPMPISPDSSVNDRFNNFHNFRCQNNGSNLNKEFELQHQMNKGLDQYFNPQTGPAPTLNALNINNYKPQNIKSDGSVSPSNKKGHHATTLEGTTPGAAAGIYGAQQAQNNANTLSTNSINEVTGAHGGQNASGTAAGTQGTVNNGNAGVPGHATSDQNLNEANQILVRKKRTRSNNQSNLDNNVLTSDITLMSPMGVFDDAIEDQNDREQSTSFDGALSKSTMNRKDRRTGFFQRKELQLHTTIRKGKTTGQNTYILSPDQVKFTQENLQHRFEEEDNDIILNLNNSTAAVMGGSSKRRVTGVATADQGLATAASAVRQQQTADELAANLSLHSEQQPIKVNTSSIVTLSHPHRKNSQSRTLNRNLDSDMRQANQNYDQKTKSMLTNGPNQQNDISTFLQNNYGSFKSVHGANATVGNADLKGIGQLAAELAQSQDNHHVRGLSQHHEQHANSNSHPAAHRKIESSFNANSYINNSSVAKTSMQKRRNISFGATGNNNYINEQSQRPSIIDLEGSTGPTNRISRPTINNTYDGSTHNNNKMNSNTQSVTPSNKFNIGANGAIGSNDSAFSNRNSRDYRNNMKKNPEMMAQKFTNSAPQPSHKFQPQGPQSSYIDELLLNSSAGQNGGKQAGGNASQQVAAQQKSFDAGPSKSGKGTATAGGPIAAANSNQRNRHSSDRSIQEIQAYYSKRRGGVPGEETATGGGTVAWEESQKVVGKYGQYGAGPGQRGPVDGALEAQFGGGAGGLHGQEIDEFSQIIFRQDCNKTYQWESEMGNPQGTAAGGKRTSEVEDKGQLLRRMGSQAAQSASYALGPDNQGVTTNTNIHDANNSYLLQKQMNSSRFGGFRTADGASQGNKIHHLNYLNHQIGGADEAAGAGNIGFIGLHPGPQSPESNQSFRIYVENRRARPKIVKTSHDHGNIFFAQQANSLKNSSQIGQRKDLASKMLPYQVLQSRGGDISSLGGITSATTAFGNNDGISQENRSGYHEIPGHNGGQNPSNNNYSYSGNGIFVGDQSHKSISDKERTPTHGQEQKQFMKMNNNNNKKEAAHGEDDEAHNTNSCEGKGKNPYYFTFFNEKNEQQQQNGGGGENGAEAPQQPTPFEQVGKSQEQQNQSNQQAQMFTLNYHQTLDQDTRRINYPIRGNHHASATQNQSVSMQNQRESELNNKSRIQKRQLIEPEPTPSFISQKQASANAQNKPKSKEGNSISQSNSYIRKRMSQNRAMISSHNGFSHDGSNGQNANMGDNSNVSRLMDIFNNSAMNDSVLSGHREPSNGGNAPNTQESTQPSYTPVRRNPGQTYQRTKPQSPKILLPQCFLDQPLNQILQSNGTSATNANQKSNARDQLGSKLEQRGGSSILSASNQNKMSMMKAKIGEIQPPQLNNVVAPNGNNFSSTLGTGIGKVTPVGNIGTLRDKNASTKMEEPRSLPAGELDLRHDEMNATKNAAQGAGMKIKYKTDGAPPAEEE